MRAIRFGSVFAGVGGLELGLEAAFAAAGIPARVVWQVEQDAYCRAVLAKHWPDADRSVVDVRAAGLLLPRVDVLCGGPPCQDISGAGKQEGLSGERSGLLFEYLRIVRELRPAVCVVENVHSGSWRVWLDAIRCGLRGLGYRVRAGGLRASDVGAPHRRARIFVVAYANGGDVGREPRWGWTRGRDVSAGAVDGCEALAHADARGSEGRNAGRESAGRHAFERGRQDPLAHADGGRSPQPQGGEQRERRRALNGGQDGTLGDADGSRRELGPGTCDDGAGLAEPADDGKRLAQSGLGRGAHGLPGGMDLPSRWPAGRGEEQHAWEPPRTIEGRQVHRRAALKALGNAVVPACSELVGRELVVPFFAEARS